MLIILVALIVPQRITPWLESLLGRTGDLGSVVVGDIERLELFFAHTLSPLLVAITVPLAATVTLGVVHWSLLLVLIPALVVVATVPHEPVSNLDAESELELTAAMDTARAGCTVLGIAHRLSTIRTADRLVGLDDGRVAEVGRHADLLAAGGTYARLIASQQRHGAA